MSSEQKFDWEEAVRLDPKGYCEVQNPRERIVIHGPVESLAVDPESDMVIIKLKWAAKMGLPGTQDFGNWENFPEATTIAFPNFIVPFVVEPTLEKGLRIRFGLNIIYIDPIESLDPAKVKGLVL